jgi:hypothetical protein
MVSAVVRCSTPLGLENTLANVAVDRGIRLILVLGRNVPQKSALSRKCNATFIAT